MSPFDKMFGAPKRIRSTTPVKASLLSAVGHAGVHPSALASAAVASAHRSEAKLYFVEREMFFAVKCKMPREMDVVMLNVR